MKKKTIILALALTLSIGIGATAYAAAAPEGGENTGLGLGRITNLRGYEYLVSVVKDKLKVTDADLDKAREDGMTISEFAEEKGLSHDDLHDALVDAKTKAVDEAMTKGTITKEEGDTLKEAIKNSESRYGLGQGQGGTPRGYGNSGSGQGLRDGSGAGRGNGNGVNCLNLEVQ